MLRARLLTSGLLALAPPSRWDQLRAQRWLTSAAHEDQWFLWAILALGSVLALWGLWIGWRRGGS